MWRLVLGTSLLVIFILVLAEARGGDPASLYDVLGVSRDASQREIRSAYKREAREWHPDKNKSPEAQDKIVQINKAYETLSDDESRRMYDMTGETDPAPSSYHSHAHKQGFTFFQTGNGFFHFGGFGHSRPRTDTVTTHHFQDAILPETTSKLWLIYFYGDFCMQCGEVSRLWDSLKEEMQLNGVGMASVHVSHHYKVASYCHVERIPSLVAIVSERVFHFHGPLHSRSIRSFVKSNLPSWTITEVSAESFEKFSTESIMRNKPRIILFSPHSQPSLLFKSVAFSSRQFVDFAFLSTNKMSEKNLAILQQYYNISARSKKLLIFKEYLQPSIALEGNDVTGSALRDLVRGLRLDLPRLTSPQMIDRFCGIDGRLCLILVVQEGSRSKSYNDSITCEFRTHAVKISASHPGIALAYIDEDSQRLFVSSFLGRREDREKKQCGNGLQERNVLLLRRTIGFQTKYDWFSGYCGSSKDFPHLLSFAEQTNLKTTDKTVPDLIDEFAPGVFEKLWDWICIKYFQVYDYALAHSQIASLLTMTVVMASMMCCAGALGVTASQETPKPRPRSEKNKQSSSTTTNSQQDVIPQLLTRDLYQQRIDTASRGDVTLLTLVHSVKDDLPAIIVKLFQRYRRRKRDRQRIHFFWASLERYQQWLEELLTESDMDPDEAGARLAHHLTNEGRKSDTVFVLLALFGSRKQFAMFPEHFSEDSNGVGITCHAIMEKSEFEGGGGGGGGGGESRLSLEDREMEKRLGVWLERLEDGSLKRYSIDCWPECLQDSI